MDTRSSDGAVRPGPFCTRPPRSGAQKCRTTGPGGAVAIATGRAACQAMFPGRVPCGRPGVRPLAGLGQQGGLEGGPGAGLVAGQRAGAPGAGSVRPMAPGGEAGPEAATREVYGWVVRAPPLCTCPPCTPGTRLFIPARPAPAEARRDHALLAGDSGQRRPRRLLGGARARPARCGAHASPARVGVIAAQPLWKLSACALIRLGFKTTGIDSRRRRLRECTERSPLLRSPAVPPPRGRAGAPRGCHLRSGASPSV